MLFNGLAKSCFDFVADVGRRLKARHLASKVPCVLN